MGERANNIPNSISNLPRRMSFCVSRINRSTVDTGLDVGSRTANFLRSAAELITMRSPVVAISYVLHNVSQRSGELGVLCEHVADSAEEYSDVTGKSRGGSRRVELRKRGVWSVVGGRGGGRRDFLNIDS